jgi:hypothetical protein
MRNFTQQGVLPPVLRHLTVNESYTAAKIGSYRCAKRIGQKLMAEAKTQIRHIHRQSLTDQILLRFEKGVLILLIHIRSTSEDDKAVVCVDIRQRLMPGLPDIQADFLRFGSLYHVATGFLPGSMLKNDKFFGHSYHQQEGVPHVVPWAPLFINFARFLFDPYMMGKYFSISYSDT